MAYLQAIENMGGVLKAIENGFIQKEIHESAYRYQRQVENREQIIVGLNVYAEEEKKANLELYYPPKRIERTQIKKTRDLRIKRSENKLKQKLKALDTAIEDGRNFILYKCH